MSLDVRVLRSIVAVIDYGSVVDAARATGYGASAISRHLGAARDQLGVALFEPRGRGIAPTPTAVALAERVRPFLEHGEAVEQYMRTLRVRCAGNQRVDVEAGRAAAALARVADSPSSFPATASALSAVHAVISTDGSRTRQDAARGDGVAR